MSLLALVAVGVAVGLVLGALGGGGAVLTVPALMWLVGATAHSAMTSSLAVVLVASTVGVGAYVREGRIDYAAAGSFALLRVPGASLGSRRTRRFRPRH